MKRSGFFTILLPLGLFLIFVSCAERAHIFFVQPVNRENLPELVILQYESFWDAVADFQPQVSDSLFFLTIEEAELGKILQMLFSGDISRCEELSCSLWINSEDPVISIYARDVLLNVLILQSKWDRYMEVANDTLFSFGYSVTKQAPNTYILVNAFSSVPEEEYLFPDTPVILPVKTALSIYPVVEAEVNGFRQDFMIDTGASFSVLASDVARQCGVLPIRIDPAESGTASIFKIGIVAAIIDSLRIGDIVVRNHPVLIIDERDLELRFPFKTILEIDAILGWNFIQNLRIQLDMPNRRIMFERSEPLEIVENNFFWAGLGQPMVRLQASDGTRLNFLLDLGSNQIYLTGRIHNKFWLTTIWSDEASVSGPGGTGTVTFDRVENFVFYLNENKFEFPNINIIHKSKQDLSTFFQPDGVIGISLARKGIVILDFPNGLFGYIPTR